MKVSVYIGRFQPFHNGHLNTIKFALQNTDKLILILGSANSPRTIKNPFTVNERIEFIKNSLPSDLNSRIVFCSVEDQLYNNTLWAQSVYDLVEKNVHQSDEIYIIGFKKDSNTAEYINFFGKWKHMVPPAMTIDGTLLDATKIREIYFLNKNISQISNFVPVHTFNFLHAWRNSNEFVQLLEEYTHAIEYDKRFMEHPVPSSYALNFLTVDACVIQSGHILLISRKKAPGKGLWALPGGHVNPNETLEDAMIRELLEETKIKVPEKVLRGSIVDSKLFDHPNRSLRGRVLAKNGRTLTNAYCIRLADGESLPKVKAADDAAQAWFFNLGEIKKMRSQLFEDHYDIITYFLNRI